MLQTALNLSAAVGCGSLDSPRWHCLQGYEITSFWPTSPGRVGECPRLVLPSPPQPATRHHCLCESRRSNELGRHICDESMCSMASVDSISSVCGPVLRMLSLHQLRAGGAVSAFLLAEELSLLSTPYYHICLVLSTAILPHRAGSVNSDVSHLLGWVSSRP
jgi:hypothetical protein